MISVTFINIVRFIGGGVKYLDKNLYIVSSTKQIATCKSTVKVHLNILLFIQYYDAASCCKKEFERRSNKNSPSYFFKIILKFITICIFLRRL